MRGQVQAEHDAPQLGASSEAEVGAAVHGYIVEQTVNYNTHCARDRLPLPNEAGVRLEDVELQETNREGISTGILTCAMKSSVLT